MPTVSPIATEKPAPPSMTPREVFDVHRNDFFNLPDLYSVGRSSRRPNELSLNFGNESSKRLADAILRDEIMGVKLVLSSRWDDTKSADPKQIPYYEWWTNHAKAASALPGVIRHNRGPKDVRFFVDSEATKNRLSGLLVDRMGPAEVLWWVLDKPKTGSGK